MAHPILYLPVLGTNPIGLAVLGTAGYLAYRAGKKAGRKSEKNLDKEPLCDWAIKEAMKTAYKTKLKLDKNLAGTRDKYATMWGEAQSEVAEKSEASS